jgi:hypothetical protein
MSASAEREIMLLSAGTQAWRSASAQRSLALLDSLDWEALIALLQSQRLLSTLGPRIGELAGDRADRGFGDAVAQAVLACAQQGELMQLLVAHIESELSSAGIRYSALKGPQLGQALYGHPGRRLSGDIDLLVTAEQLPDAVEVVCGLGYERPSDHVGRDGLPLLHFTLSHPRGELPPVELHWRIHWYERNFASQVLLAPRGDPLAGWCADPAAQLLALLLFYARDGFIGLRLASDISACWDTYGGDLQAAGLEQLLCAYPALRRAVVAAAVVAERLVGLPAQQLLDTESVPGALRKIALRLANPDPHADRAQLYAEVGLVDWLLAPRGGRGEVFHRQVLVPREVRVQRAVRAGRPRPSSALGHGARVSARYAIALARLARHR